MPGHKSGMASSATKTRQTPGWPGPPDTLATGPLIDTPAADPMIGRMNAPRTIGNGLYRWELLGLLWLAFFLHQGDRHIYNTVLPLIRSNLELDDVQLGWVASLFTLVYGVLVPVGGFVGDRFPRKWVVVLSLLLFSVGTLLSGLSTGLVMLILFRSFTTGGGEAFFYPSATSLLAQFHEKTRALALGLLQTALYVGITVSGWLAGYLGEEFGWRVPFLLFGSAGLVWTLATAWRLQDTPPVAAHAERVPLLETLVYVLRRPSAWLLTLAFGAMVYVNVAYMTWTTDYLQDRYELSLTNAGFSAMFYHYLAAFLGVLAGSRLADRLAPRYRSIRMAMNFVGLLLGAPFVYWLGRAETAVQCCTALALFGLFRGVYDSNLLASLLDVVEPRLRSSATGLMFCFAFVVGSVAPTALGWMKTRVGLAAGFSSLCWFYLFGAACILVAMTCFLRRDYVAPKDTHS